MDEPKNPVDRYQDGMEAADIMLSRGEPLPEASPRQLATDPWFWRGIRDKAIQIIPSVLA